MSTNVEVMEVIESKVTKSEMIEMLIYEEEEMLQKELKELREEADRVRSGIPYQRDTFEKIQKHVLAYFKKNYPIICKQVSSLGELVCDSCSTNAVHMFKGLKEVVVYMKPGSETQGVSSNYTSNRKIIHPANTYNITAPMYVRVRSKVSHSSYEYFKMLVRIDNIPQVQKIIASVVKKSEELTTVNEQITEAVKQLSYLESKGKKVKSHLTKSLLNSTPEGRDMLERLKKVKLKVTKQQLLDI